MNETIQFGKYQILEELGRGGFGIVYHAFDTVLEVERAIKELYPNLVNDPSFVSRFRQEARVAAKLDHPNLVSVHDFGQIGGKYYLAMGYMPGGSLKDLIKREGKLVPKRALEILEQVGAGLSYAHSQGVIHRDLKPGNILFDGKGQARVSDLGFARVMNVGSSQSLSVSGGLVGTPAYMAPETWRNKPATPQTDIYSLGCILYEMLTGEVLFEGESPAEVMTMHLIDGPKYAGDLPKGTRAVLDKALQREPQERYEDVKSLLAGFRSVVKAKWEERDFIPTLTIPPVTIGTKPNTNSESKLLTEIMEEAGFSEEQTQTPPASMETGLNTNSESELLKETVKVEDFSEEQTQGLQVPVDESTKKRWQDSILRSIDIRNLLLVLLTVGLILMGRYFIRSIPWGKMSGTEVIYSDNAPQVKQLGRTRFLRSLFGDAYVNVLVWSPDGKTLASGGQDGKVRFWDLSSGSQLRTFNGQIYGVKSIAWSPDGKTLETGSYRTIILWDAGSGSQLRTLEGHNGWVNSVAWSPDGKTLASGSVDRTIILWDADSGSQLRTLEGHTSYVMSVAWSPDGKTLASGSYRTIILWDPETGSQLRTLKGHTGSVYSVAWSPDGKTLASGSNDNTIILWDAGTGSQLRTLKGHTYGVVSVAWSPDGKTLASGSWDKTIILWDAGSGSQLRALEGHPSYVWSVAWSPDGKTLASGSSDHTVILWDTSSGAKLRTLEGHTSDVMSVAWSPDGKTLASGDRFKNVLLWDAGSGRQLCTLEGHTDGVTSVAWSPDGKTLASSSYDRTIRFWGIP